MNEKGKTFYTLGNQKIDNLFDCFTLSSEKFIDINHLVRKLKKCTLNKGLVVGDKSSRSKSWSKSVHFGFFDKLSEEDLIKVKNVINEVRIALKIPESNRFFYREDIHNSGLYMIQHYYIKQFN